MGDARFAIGSLHGEGGEAAFATGLVGLAGEGAETRRRDDLRGQLVGLPLQDGLRLGAVFTKDRAEIIPAVFLDLAGETALARGLVELYDGLAVDEDLEMVIDLGLEGEPLRIGQLDLADPFDLETIGGNAGGGAAAHPVELDRGVLPRVGRLGGAMADEVSADQSLAEGTAAFAGETEIDLPARLEIELVGGRIGEVVDELVDEGEEGLARHEIARRKIERDP